MRDYYIHNYRPMLQAVVDKCEEQFEGKISYIAAGALGLSFAFISDIVDIYNGICLFLLLLGWVFLIACICMNCHSHLLAKNYAKKSIGEIDEGAKDDEFNWQNIADNIAKRNTKTENINLFTIWLMTLGALFILAFAAINIINSGDKETQNNLIKSESIMKEFSFADSIKHEGELEELGYSMPTPQTDVATEHETAIEQANNNE